MGVNVNCILSVKLSTLQLQYEEKLKGLMPESIREVLFCQRKDRHADRQSRWTDVRLSIFVCSNLKEL